MSNWSSERRLRFAVLASIVSVIAAGLAFHVLQNRLALTGGGIAWPKSMWLSCAILFWFLLPGLLLVDTRLARAWRAPFVALLVLMMLRGIVELWMLYVSHNWSPYYGIAHDIVCLAALWGLALRAGVGAGLQRISFTHAMATGLLFVPEIYFAWYMQQNFRTQGEAPLYFVPDDAAHSRVLALTMAADAAAALYLPSFLYAWLHGKTEAADPRARHIEP